MTATADPLAQAEALVVDAMSQLEHALALVHAHQAGTSPTHFISPAEDLLRQCAYLHDAHLKAHGSLTQADSIKIRRELYGKGVRATANQFGDGPHANTNFYRVAELHSKVEPAQDIRLTKRGEERAEAYRQEHNLP